MIAVPAREPTNPAGSPPGGLERGEVVKRDV
jgi:hypothetical protein